MIVASPQQQVNGALLYKDHAIANRAYLHPAIPQTKHLKLNKLSNGKHQFSCEFNFGIRNEDRSLLPREFEQVTIVTVPWEAGVVKVWGSSGNRLFMISSGSISGTAIQNSIHQSTLSFMPYQVWITTELKANAFTTAQLKKIKWRLNKPVELYKLLDIRVDSAWRERQKITFAMCALDVLEQLQAQQELEIVIEGIGKNDLERQILLSLVNELIADAYRGEKEGMDIVNHNPASLKLNPQLPGKSVYDSSTIQYRLPVIYQLGLLPGECEYKAAPGIDWSSILSINVYGDGETRETVYKKELKPYFNAVLTRSRMAVKQEQPRPLHVWTEANHRSYSNPLRLPSPTIVEDAYSSIDVPSTL